MSVTIVISAHPDSATNQFALAYCETLLSQKTPFNVFCLGPAVRLADSAKKTRWLSLASEIEAHLCVSSAQQYGLVDDSGRPQASLHDAFQVSGLAQLAIFSTQNKLINFGQRVA